MVDWSRQSIGDSKVFFSPSFRIQLPYIYPPLKLISLKDPLVFRLTSSSSSSHSIRLIPFVLAIKICEDIAPFTGGKKGAAVLLGEEETNEIRPSFKKGKNINIEL